MRGIRWATCAFFLTIAVVATRAADAVTVGQADTFEDGTTMGWFIPATSPSPPANVPDGGPAGAGDAFLRLVATGSAGPGSRLSVLNEAQWSGDYLASGVRRIRMDLNNFGPADLSLRLLFEDLSGTGSLVNLALSADAVFVPANSGWMTLSFEVDPSDLFVETGSASGALANVDTLRIFHNPDADFPGPGAGIPTVTATLGVDNITALPEPSTALLFAGGLGLLLVWRRRTGAPPAAPGS